MKKLLFFGLLLLVSAKISAMLPIKIRRMGPKVYTDKPLPTGPRSQEVLKRLQDQNQQERIQHAGEMVLARRRVRMGGTRRTEDRA